MTKFAFVFVFAFFVLQVSNVTSLKTNFSDVTKANNDADDLITEINKVLNDVSKREDKIRKQLDDKFTKIKTTADFAGLVAELKQNITQILAGGNADDCDNEAWESVKELEESLSSLDSCRSKIDNEMADFKKQLQTIVSSVKELLTKTGKDVEDCQRYSLGSNQKFIEGVQRTVANAKEKLKIYDRALQDILLIVEAFLPSYYSMMTSCVDGIKLEFVEDMKELIEDVQRCIESNSRI